VLICATCGRENADDARFCSGCGAALAAPAEKREERKVVSVVFVDLVGSAALAERLDMEDVRAQLASYHSRVRAELERHGGTVEKFIGDAVVAVFGAPVVHEDDAERAVRAAIAIRDTVAGEDVSLRIAVNTGEALVTVDARPSEGEGMVTGDVVNTAARLQSAAPVDGILVGEGTVRASAQTIEYREAVPVVAKGKMEPIRAWEAVAARSSFGLDVEQAPTVALVGRGHELDLLRDSFARSRAKRSAQLVTLVGVPGIGKSRLVAELFRIVDEDPDLIFWRQGRCLPYGEGISFWALGEMTKAHVGVLEGDSAEEAEGKLAETVAGLVPGADDARWVADHLRPLLGMSSEQRADAEGRAETFAAWRRFLEAVAELRPTVLVFEDLHWADDGLIEFIDGLVDRVTGVPLLVVCSARPELLTRRPGWGGGKANAVTLSLAPLSDEDTSRLIAELLSQAVLPADMQRALLTRAEGNPLFAEEYIRMLQDRDLLRRDGDVWRLADDDVEVPDTVQGIIAARLDALSVSEKSLAQAASVLGKVFWLGSVSALDEVGRFDAEELLHSLERKELVRRERRASVGGETEYAFRHVLVRDVAYSQIPRARRSALHAAAADWIEGIGAERAEDRAEMLAHHLVSAVEYGRAAGLDVEELVPRAVDALVAAGDRAWSLAAVAPSLVHFERAAALLGEVEEPRLLLRLGRSRLLVSGQGGEQLARAAELLRDTDPAAAAQAEMVYGESIWQRGDRDRAFPHFERAAAAVAQLPVSSEKAFVVGQVGRFFVLAGRIAAGLAHVEEAIPMAEALGDDALLVDLLNTRGVGRMNAGDDAGLVDLERAFELAETAKSAFRPRLYVNLASVLFDVVADLDRAEEVMRDGLRVGERLELDLSQRWFHQNLADVTFHKGMWDEALAHADAVIEEGEAHYLTGGALVNRSLIRLARGDVEGGRADAERCAELGRQVRDPQALLPALATLAFHAASTRDVGRARAAVAEVLDEQRALGESRWQGPAVVLVVFALLELGLEEEFRGTLSGPGTATPWFQAASAVGGGDLVRAADILQSFGAVAFEANVRVRAAQRLARDGRRADAADQLAPALAFYRGVGAAGAIREAEALLPAAG
jgi:class 3 adenylate cyclase/tetratricopeptide (TPR) repeat protein